MPRTLDPPDITRQLNLFNSNTVKGWKNYCDEGIRFSEVLSRNQVINFFICWCTIFPLECWKDHEKLNAAMTPYLGNNSKISLQKLINYEFISEKPDESTLYFKGAVFVKLMEDRPEYYVDFILYLPETLPKTQADSSVDNTLGDWFGGGGLEGDDDEERDTDSILSIGR